MKEAAGERENRQKGEKRMQLAIMTQQNYNFSLEFQFFKNQKLDFLVQMKKVYHAKIYISKHLPKHYKDLSQEKSMFYFVQENRKTTL